MMKTLINYQSLLEKFAGELCSCRTDEGKLPINVAPKQGVQVIEEHSPSSQGKKETERDGAALQWEPEKLMLGSAELNLGVILKRTQPLFAVHTAPKAPGVVCLLDSGNAIVTIAGVSDVAGFLNDVCGSLDLELSDVVSYAVYLTPATLVVEQALIVQYLVSLGASLPSAYRRLRQ
jgi:hypothetical protein